MASGKVKGISIEIGGNTVGLTKALQDVNKQTNAMQNELKQVERLLKLDPKNTELLAQKQELLGNEIAITKDKLEALKKAEEQANNDMKNGVEVNQTQYRKLQREIVSTEQNLKSLQKETSKFKEVGDKLSSVGSKMTDLGKKGMIATGAIVGGLVAAAETTREYREDMNRLETAFITSEKTAEQARKAYDGFYQILGESDRSVEAVNHLAKLCTTEQELAMWTDICAGVSATFGDSLPIEGLTEAANETAKVGKVTGPLADALNWAGIMEDDFNEKLKACSNEQERSKLITETLGNTYQDAAGKFKETNKDVMASREATQRFNDAVAQLGETVEPIITAIKNKVAELMEWFTGLDSNAQSIIMVIGGIVAVAGPLLMIIGSIASGVGALTALFAPLTAATTTATAAQTGLNLAFLANPITLIIAGIVALVATFVTLWNKCDAFRNFWINLWDGIVSGTKAAIDGICKFFTETLPNAFKAVIDFVKNNWKELLLLLTNPIAGAIALLYKLNPKFKEWVDGLLAKIKAWFAGMKDIGKNILDGLWSGISNGTKWLLDKVKEWCGSIMKGIKAFFGIKSPSRVMRDEIGKMIDAGLAEGLEGNIDMVKSAMDNVGVTVINSAEDMRKGVADSLKSTVSEFDTAFGNIEKSRDGLAEKLRGENQFIDIHTVSINGQEVKRYNTLADYTDENSILSTYFGLLDQLNEKLGGEVPEALIENLRTMDASAGTEYVKIILDSTDEEIQNYIKGKSENELLSQSIAEKLYKPEFEELGNNIIDEIDKIPSNFAVAGEDSAETFGEGFMAQFKTVVNRIKETIGNTLNIPTAELSLVGGGNSNVVNTTINQTITATPDTAYTVAKETKKTMNGIIGMAVMR